MSSTSTALSLNCCCQRTFNHQKTNYFLICRLGIPSAILHEIFMQINRILTKLWRLKLGGPVIIPHRVDLEVWCRHHSRPIRLSNFLVIILIIIVIIVGRCKVVCVCKCSCTRKQKPKVMESMTLRLCTEQQTRRLFMQRACVLLIWHLLLTLCFSECRTHQGHVQKLTGRIGRTIGTAYLPGELLNMPLFSVVILSS